MENITIPFLKIATKLGKSNHVVDVFGTLVEARSVLVFMPDKLEDFGIARKHIFKLLDDFPKAEFQFVIRQSYHSFLNSDKNYGTIFVTHKDVNFFGLPKKELKQKILSTKYDIVIDLNVDFHLLSTYLCQISGASLKICFDHNNRELFYNFCFRTQLNDSLENKYRKLIKYINNCVNSTTVEN